MTAETAVMTTRDETAEVTGNRYRYTRIVDTAGHVVRVLIERHFYDSYSYAHVEVINDLKGWTLVLDEPAGDWWDATPPPRKDTAAAVLAPLAERLLRRAAAILAPPTTTTAAVSPRVLDAVAALLAGVHGYDGERRIDPDEITWAGAHGGALRIIEHPDGGVTFTKFPHRDGCPLVTSAGAVGCDDECDFEQPTRLDGRPTS